MDSGARTLLSAGGIITDWAKQHFGPVSSPLPVVANLKVAFDLLTPMDNSRHGSSMQQGVQKLKQYGLEFPGIADSQTMFKGSGLTGLSFVMAFRLSAADVFQYVPDCRDLAPDSGHGFVITFSPIGQRLEPRVGWSDGSQGIYYQSEMSIIVNKWYVACGVISPNRNHKLTPSDDTAIAASPIGYLASVAGSPPMLGTSATGSSTLKGGMRFFGAWGNEFTMGDIVTAIALGINIVTDKGQTV